MPEFANGYVRTPFDDHWYFYLCDELDCAFQFRVRNKHRWNKRFRPILDGMIFVVPLDKKVRIKLVGRGEAAYQKVLEHGHGEYVFPMDLFSQPHRIDPKPSKKVTQELYDRWVKLIASFKQTALQPSILG